MATTKNTTKNISDAKQEADAVKKSAAAKVATPKTTAPKSTAPKTTALKAMGDKIVKPKADTVEPSANLAIKATSDVVKLPAVDKKPTAVKANVEEKPTAVKANVEDKPTAVKSDNIAPAKDKHKILFVASEAYPFAGTGGLGEVMGSLPKAINDGDNDCEARVILPLYDSFPAMWRDKLQFICHINVPLGWRNQYCGLFSLFFNNVTYYFVDNEYYFKRPNLYGYYDDGERFAFLSRAVIELIPYLNWKPDVLHCQDWQTALTPIYYKLFYMYREGLGGIKTIFTIHNIEYQGKYARSILEDVFGIPNREYLSVEHRGCINLMKGAIDYSDSISTVSPSYACEIMQPFYAHGLEGILIKNSYKLRGILNGVDIDTYNPTTNPALFKNYSAETIKDKKVNKTELQKMLSLPVTDAPMIAVISRLVSHKGLDLVRATMNEILKKDVQVIILGKGDPDYEGYFAHLQNMYNQKVCSIIAYNKDLSHKIYAAADIFLMPSKSEPCGLSQMMACRYGTIPVVRATGGLRDSITDCDTGDVGNGFLFNNYDGGDMLHAIDRAVGLYCDYHDKWEGLKQRAMATDFSWGVSAREYVKFYHELLS